MKRGWVEIAIGAASIVAGIGLSEVWECLLRRLPSTQRPAPSTPRLGEGIESGGPDDA